MDDFDCDILIVGGGPTGVTLGLLSAQQGARVMICEKEADIYPLPRAAHIDHEVMRIFQQAGAADVIAASSRCTTHYDFLTADGQILLRFEGSDQVGPGGWPAANMIHQPSVERALRDRLGSVENVDLRSGWEFTGFSQDDVGVVVRFETADGSCAVRAKYLVGADGARSPVREMAGIAIDDLGFDEPWLVIDTIVHDFDRLPKINLQICDPARPTTCVLMGAGRHRWEFMIRPGETAEEVLDDAFIAALLAPWNVEGAVTLERKAVYRFHAKVAREWRKGRVLIAGDAAHQTPPFAGQGMCAGIRDAANLAWKLGLVVTGGADDAILGGYQTEREPHVRATIGIAMMMGQTVCITDPAAAAERDAQMLAARAAGQSPDGAIAWPPITDGLILSGSAGAGRYFPQSCSGELRFDDVQPHGEWLLTRDGVAASPFADDVIRWLDAHDTEAVLVRPDRHIFGTGAATELHAAWATALNSPDQRAI